MYLCNKYPKIKWLKIINIYYLILFFLSRESEAAYLVILIQGLKRTEGGSFPSLLMWLSAGLRTPVSKLLTWLSAGLRTLAVSQRHQFLGHMGFSMGLLTIWQLVYSKARYLSESPQNRSQSFYNLILGVISCYSAKFCSLEVSH